MNYGGAATVGAHRWALDDAAQPFFRQVVAVGRASNRYSRRGDIVLARKVCGKMHDGPGGARSLS